MKSRNTAVFACAFLAAAVYAQSPAGTSEPVQAVTAAGSTNAASVGPVTFQLKPTAVAPMGASGTAVIQARVLSVHLTQLGPGRYQLEAGRHSGGRFERLGAITIVDPTLAPSRQATDNKKEASANPESVSINTDVSITLPAGLGPRDISSVRLLGAGGNAVLDSQDKH